MQESNKPTQEEAFWKNPEAQGATELDHLGDDKEMEVSQIKTRFRHRVVGAVVLVAALATALPILFEKPAIEADRHAHTTIPPISKEPFYKMELPVNGQPKASMPADPNALKDLSKPNVVKEAPEARPTPELEQAQVQTASTYAPTQDGSLYIQVLATSSEAGAMREMARYQAMGLPVYSVKVQKKSATLWRVRLGLFKTKEEADRVVKLLDSKKISHMPVQVEASAKKEMNRIAPARTLESAAQEAHSRSQVKAAKPAPVAKTSKPAPVKKAEVKPQKAVTKPAAKAPTNAAKKPAQPERKAAVKQQNKGSADPLADLLKSTREEDVISQKLREARQ